MIALVDSTLFAVAVEASWANTGFAIPAANIKNRIVPDLFCFDISTTFFDNNINTEAKTQIAATNNNATNNTRYST